MLAVPAVPGAGKDYSSGLPGGQDGEGDTDGDRRLLRSCNPAGTGGLGDGQRGRTRRGRKQGGGRGGPGQQGGSQQQDGGGLGRVGADAELAPVPGSDLGQVGGVEAAGDGQGSAIRRERRGATHFIRIGFPVRRARPVRSASCRAGQWCRPGPPGRRGGSTAER